MTRIAIGTKVVMNAATVPQYIWNDPSYSGAGTVIKDDESCLPYLVRFEDTGITRWFEEEELLLATASKFRVMLTKNAIDKDGDVLGSYFVTKCPVNPDAIEEGIEGVEGNVGFSRVRDQLAAKPRANTTLSVGSIYKYAYVLVDGRVMALTSFNVVESKVIHTKQLEIGSYYIIESTIVSTLPEGSVVQLLEQEPEGYQGLSYLVRKVNSTESTWLPHTTVFIKA